MNWDTHFRKLVIMLTALVILGCRAPEPMRETYGDALWDFVDIGDQWEFYRATSVGTGPNIGPNGLKIASSGRATPDIAHKMWSVFQKHDAFDPAAKPEAQPKPQFLIRLAKGAETAFVAIDVDSAFLTFFRKGSTTAPQWLSFRPAQQQVRELLFAQFEMPFSN